MNFWRVANFVVFLMWLLVGALGTFYKHIAFGWGLGDILWYGMMYLFILIQALIVWRNYKKNPELLWMPTLIFGALLIWFCLEATIWRDTEYPWNGQIFYY